MILAARLTFSLVLLLTLERLFKTLLAVEGETPAARATSFNSVCPGRFDNVLLETIGNQSVAKMNYDPAELMTVGCLDLPPVC